LTFWAKTSSAQKVSQKPYLLGKAANNKNLKKVFTRIGRKPDLRRLDEYIMADGSLARRKKQSCGF